MGAASNPVVHASRRNIEMELKQFIYVNELSTGRRLYALMRVQAAAARRNAVDLVAFTQQAIVEDRETRELDLRWHVMRSQRRPATNIGPLDSRVDTTITGLRDGAVVQARGAAPDDPIHQQVDIFLAEVLPAGVYAVTSKPYVEQLSELENIVEKLEGPLAPMVTELGLERQADRLSELLPLYRDAINGASENERVTFASVRAARRRGQRRLYEIIAMTLGMFYRADDPEHQTARAELLGPNVEQNEAVRAYLRARRAVRDVDPETGEPLPETGEPANDQPAASPPAA
jgi:hypothetical protein